MFLWFLGASAPAEVDEPRSLQSRTGRIVEVPYIPPVLDAETQRKVLKGEQDHEIFMRIKDRQMPIADHEIGEILENTDYTSVEVELLERMKEEHRNEMVLFVLDVIVQRYNAAIQKIHLIKSLEEVENLINYLCNRVHVFALHAPDKGDNWPEVIATLYEQVCHIQGHSKCYVFSDLFERARFEEFKIAALYSLPNELIIKIVEFMIRQEPPLYKKNVLELVGDRLPADVLRALQKWEVKESVMHKVRRKWNEMMTRDSDEDD